MTPDEIKRLNKGLNQSEYDQRKFKGSGDYSHKVTGSNTVTWDDGKKTHGFSESMAERRRREEKE